MKPLIHTALSLAAVMSASAAWALQKNDDMKGMDMPGKKAPAAPVTHHATGVIRKIDAPAGVVTFAHGAVPSLKWPAMTMGFQVRDKAMLDKFAVGQTVDFDFVQGTQGFVVTAIR